jgi:hypothetical protein
MEGDVDANTRRQLQGYTMRLRRSICIFLRLLAAGFNRCPGSTDRIMPRFVRFALTAALVFLMGSGCTQEPPSVSHEAGHRLRSWTA